MKLSRRNIATLVLPPGKTEYTEWDDDIGGFGFRMRKSGSKPGGESKTLVFQYDFAGKTRRITLGNIDPAKARAIASELHAKVRLGQDPAAVKAENQARAAETFGAAVKPYLQWQQARVRPSTLRHLERHLLVNLAPLHSLPIDRKSTRLNSSHLGISY